MFRTDIYRRRSKTDRIILHCDLNNFFASVSLLYNQTLVNSPVAVCGSKENRHGIVLAKNELAKKYGVKTAEPIWQAKNKCPDLITIPPDYQKYEEFSLKAKQIYARYTDMIEPFGIDECWLDVTGSTLLFGSGEEIAERIRKEIKAELGITVSIGVSFNKIFAKLGSDMKKPDGITVISRENYKEKVWSQPVETLLFVGKNTAKKLNSSGIFTIGDVTLCDDKMLQHMLGKNGLELKKYALGEDGTVVRDMEEYTKPKSIGRSVTEGTDFTDNNSVWRTFIVLAEDIGARLKKHGLYAGGIQVHTRDTSLKVKEFSHSFETATDISIIIAERAMKLFKENYNWDLPLRSVGIRAISLKDSLTGVQQDIFRNNTQDETKEKIEESIFSIRKKFGENSIKRGRTMKKP